MNIYPKTHLVLLLATLVLLLHIAPAQGQAGSQYALVAGSVSSGGTASAGQYGLAGAAGQVAAGTASGGNYTVVGGFLTNLPPPEDPKVYLPLISR